LAIQASLINVVDPWMIAIYMVSSTIAPCIFLISFVITFLAYRTRSMPFCFVHRGPGRQDHTEPWRDDDEEVLQPLVRPAVLVVAIRIFALGLLILNFIVNFDVMWSEPNLAGKTGWATVVMMSDPNNNNNSDMDQIILALVPMALVSLSCLYFSLLLWRYGCELSLVIYSSGVINPWLTPVIGSLAMIVGQLFGPDLFLITSNSGILLYMLSLVRILYEAQRDLEVSGDLGHFLDVLGNDNITRTQYGVDKDAHGDEEDTLSSGQQHQQWVLNESINEVTIASASASASVHDTEAPVRVPSKTESYTSQTTTKSRGRTPTIKTSNLQSLSQKQKSQPPDQAATSTIHNNKEALRKTTTTAAAATTTATTTMTSSAVESPIKNTSDHDNDVKSEIVQGISERPNKEVRRGQRPKGKYVVY
jgi:hypothetical protein